MMEVTDVTGQTAVSNIKAPSIGMALDGREDGGARKKHSSRDTAATPRARRP